MNAWKFAQSYQYLVNEMSKFIVFLQICTPSRGQLARDQAPSTPGSRGVLRVISRQPVFASSRSRGRARGISADNAMPGISLKVCYSVKFAYFDVDYKGQSQFFSENFKHRLKNGVIFYQTTQTPKNVNASRELIINYCPTHLLKLPPFTWTRDLCWGPLGVTPIVQQLNLP